MTVRYLFHFFWRKLVWFTYECVIFRCAVSENDTFAIQSPQHELLINRSVPPSEFPLLSTYSKCNLYSYHSNNDSNPEDSRFIRKCSKWVYEQTDFHSTFVTEVSSGKCKTVLTKIWISVEKVKRVLLCFNRRKITPTAGKIGPCKFNAESVTIVYFIHSFFHIKNDH
jgi:hypothetical protein